MKLKKKIISPDKIKVTFLYNHSAYVFVKDVLSLTKNYLNEEEQRFSGFFLKVRNLLRSQSVDVSENENISTKLCFNFTK